jgi:ASC-1-like (ASCH) protein
MIHHLNLYPGPFAELQAGTVHTELRLNYDKYANLEVGDAIIFSNREAPHETIRKRVTYLKTYPSFKALYNGVRHLYPDWEEDGFIQSMYRYYTPEQEGVYGALEIGLGPQGEG